MRSLRVFSRPGCHLCEDMVEALLPLVRGRLHVEVVNIDHDPELISRYGLRIPILEFEGQPISKFTLNKGAVLDILAKIAADPDAAANAAPASTD